MKQSTLCYLIKDGQILLAQKKRGFGVGKLNGVGGKVELGETAEQSAVREIKEEIGVEVGLGDLIDIGNLTFHSENPDLNWTSRIFVIRSWQGEPVETEEMLPKWFLVSEVPYGQMWIDDVHWLPCILEGKRIEAEFYFNNDASKIEKFTIKEI